MQWAQVNGTEQFILGGLSILADGAPLGSASAKGFFDEWYETCENRSVAEGC